MKNAARPVVALLALLIVAGTTRAQAAGQGFQPRRAEGWLDAPRHLSLELAIHNRTIDAAGDIDGDGRTDLLAFHFSNSPILPIWNVGTDEYEVGVEFGTSYSRYVRLLMDVTGDGRPELVTDDLESQYGLIVHLNEAGSLAPPLRIDTGDLRSWIGAPGEIDGDAGRELVEIFEDLATNQFSIRWWNWNGSTLVPGPSTLVGPQPWSIDTADLNADGRDEVIVGTEDAEQVFLLTTGAGAALVVTEIIPIVTNPVTTTPRPLYVAFGDLDTDNDPDGMVAWSPPAPESPLLVLRNDGSVPLVPEPIQSLAIYGSVGSLHPVDWDGDGDLDLVLGSQRLYMLENTGERLFSIRGRVPMSSGLSRQIVGVTDLNHDGYPDYVGQLAVKSGNGHFEDTVAGLTSNMQFPRVVDLDGDGDLDLVTRQRRIWENDGTGHFEVDDIADRMVPPPATNSFTVRSVGDFDGDDELDFLVVFGGTQNSAMALVRGLGDGLYAYAGAAAALNVGIGGNALLGIPPVDLDGDGDLDVLDGEGWGENDGSGFFVRNDVWSGNSLTSGDVDLDGDADVAVASNLGAHLYRNDGAGSFEQSLLTSMSSGEIHFVDFDRDGLPEFVTNAFPSTAQVHVYCNEGGSFPGAPLVLGTPSFSNQFLRFDDFDGDGRLDMLGTRPRFESNGGESTLIWRQLPGPTLAFGDPRYHYTEVRAVASGDFDGDGDLDLLRERMIRGWRNNPGRDGKIRRMPEAPLPGGVIQPELDAFGSLQADSTLTFSLANAPGWGWLVITESSGARLARLRLRPGKRLYPFRLPEGLAGSALKARAYFPERAARRGITVSNALELEL